MEDDSDPLFDDIDGHWAQNYINAMARSGWLIGYDGLGGRFMPDQPISRAETAAKINRVFGRMPYSQASLLPDMRVWPDNMNPDSWYYLYIQEASNSHYCETIDGTHGVWTELIYPEREWERLELPSSRPEDIFRTRS